MEIFFIPSKKSLHSRALNNRAEQSPTGCCCAERLVGSRLQFGEMIQPSLSRTGPVCRIRIVSTISHFIRSSSVQWSEQVSAFTFASTSKRTSQCKSLNASQRLGLHNSVRNVTAARERLSSSARLVTNVRQSRVSDGRLA